MALDRRATRLGVLGLVGVILFSLLGVRLWFLQTIRADDLQLQTSQAKRREVTILPVRGRIFDVWGRILADNERVLTVAVDWQQLSRRSEREEIFRRLSGWVGVPMEDMEARFDARIDSPFLPMPIARDVDEETAAALLERKEDFPGLEILHEYRRVYPYAPHAAHVVGYMGAITEEQWEDELEAAGYQLSERVGRFGVELSLQELLRGTPGYEIWEVDAANRPVRLLDSKPAINGKDIQLTIDLKLQQYVEQTIETTAKARRNVEALNPRTLKPNGRVERMDATRGDLVPYKSPAASSIVMDYSDGSIIAMASYPTFDNRWFEAGLSTNKINELFPSKNPDGSKIDPDRSILVNRAIQGRYNLGSTFKPFTAFAALNTGLFEAGAGYYYPDEGVFRLDDRSVDSDRCNAGLVRCEFKNAICSGTRRPCVYGYVNVEDALAVSSDAYFYNIGEKIMLDNNNAAVLQEQVRLFGFGRDPRVELPYAFDGTVPDAALKKRYAELDVISDEEGESYFVADNVQLAIGQGLLSASPLQLTNAYATIANGGTLYQPKIVEAVWEPGVPDGAPGFVDFTRGTIADGREQPEVIRQIPMPDEIRDPIVRGLTRVIGPCCGVAGKQVGNDYRKTTGEHLFFDYPSDAIPLAGKTGTAQGANSYPWNDSSAFTAFSLDETQPYVITAYVEKAGYGSQAAAPIVKCIFMERSGLIQAEEVELSDPLDLSSTVAAPPMGLADAKPACWNSKDGSGVLTGTPSVD